jgi:hypothetical protein
VNLKKYGVMVGAERLFILSRKSLPHGVLLGGMELHFSATRKFTCSKLPVPFFQ